MADITALIRADHHWFREQFAQPDNLRAQAQINHFALERVRRPLGDRLDMHAYIAHGLFAWHRQPQRRLTRAVGRLRFRVRPAQPIDWVSASGEMK
jgi:hypothetical protein